MGKKILIADDEKQFTFMLSERLKNHGYTVLIADNGVQALEIARKEKLDLIILDIVMPKLDGTATARKLKQHPETKDVPVIFLTALKTKEEQNQHGTEGANITFAKPFEPEELLSKVNELLNHDGAEVQTKQQVMIKFLVVDTSAAMRKMMIETIYQGKVFKTTNTQMLEAGSGDEGLTVFKSNNPQIVLANWNLPKTDGITMARAIRVLDKRIPILMIATQGEEAKVQPLVKEGVATDYFLKPLTAGVLEEKLLKIFQQMKQTG